jgi:hypothetical protein
MTSNEAHWDVGYRRGPSGRGVGHADPVLVAALEHFGNVANRGLLDLGCGTVKASLFFADRGASAVGIDTSKWAIDGLRAYCVERNAKNATFIHMWARRQLVGELWNPKHGDEEEFPFTSDRISTWAKYVRVEFHYPELVMWRPISTYLFYGRGYCLLRKLYDLLYRARPLRRYSYRQCILGAKCAEEITQRTR